MFLQFNATGDVTWPTYRRFETIAATVLRGHPNLRSDYLRSLHRMVAARVPHANIHLTRLHKYLCDVAALSSRDSQSAASKLRVPSKH